MNVYKGLKGEVDFVKIPKSPLDGERPRNIIEQNDIFVQFGQENSAGCFWSEQIDRSGANRMTSNDPMVSLSPQNRWKRVYYIKTVCKSA